MPVDNRMKIKENEERNKYFDLARELKRQWNIKVMMIETNWCVRNIFQSLRKGLEELKVQDQAEIIQMIAWFRSARILRKVLAT